MNHYIRAFQTNGRNRYRIIRPDGTLVVTLDDKHAAVVICKELDGERALPYGDYLVGIWKAYRNPNWMDDIPNFLKPQAE